jgi:hypothetical protein
MISILRSAEMPLWMGKGAFLRLVLFAVVLRLLVDDLRLGDFRLLVVLRRELGARDLARLEVFRRVVLFFRDFLRAAIASQSL